VQTAATHAEYDALDVSQWTFYVMSRDAVEANGYKSLGLPTLERLSEGPVAYAGLAEAIAGATVGH
jgi:hypothetical protein